MEKSQNDTKKLTEMELLVIQRNLQIELQKIQNSLKAIDKEFEERILKAIEEQK